MPLLNFEDLLNLLPDSFLMEFWLWPPKPHSQILCQINLCLPTRSALTSPLITVLGSSHAPNCQAAQAGLSYASFTNSMGAFAPLASSPLICLLFLVWVPLIRRELAGRHSEILLSGTLTGGV